MMIFLFNNNNNNNNILTINYLLLLIIFIKYKLVESIEFVILDHEGESTRIVRPTSGRATLINGVDLHFQCEQIGKKNANFKWFKRNMSKPEDENPIYPEDECCTIQNDKLTILKPNIDSSGDYVCKLLDIDGKIIPREYSAIKVRPKPYIDEFHDLPITSHTGNSITLNEGDRIELLCNVTERLAKVSINWLKSPTPDDKQHIFPIEASSSSSASFSPSSSSSASDSDQQQFYNKHHSTPPQSAFINYLAKSFDASDQSSSIKIETIDKFSKKLIIESVRAEHRGFYSCIADNGITETFQRNIFIRVKDNYVALWPFLGIIAEILILFTIIYIWETQRAYKDINSSPPSGTNSKGIVTSSSAAASSSATTNKRLPSGASVPYESVPLTSG